VPISEADNSRPYVYDCFCIMTHDVPNGGTLSSSAHPFALSHQGTFLSSVNHRDLTSWLVEKIRPFFTAVDHLCRSRRSSSVLFWSPISVTRSLTYIILRVVFLRIADSCIMWISKHVHGSAAYNIQAESESCVSCIILHIRLPPRTRIEFSKMLMPNILQCRIIYFSIQILLVRYDIY
jgi:hypothetical protein